MLSRLTFAQRKLASELTVVTMIFAAILMVVTSLALSTATAADTDRVPCPSGVICGVSTR